MSGRLQVLINLRSQSAGLRGVQRYTAEVFGRLADRVATVAPRRPMNGVRGHLWEQTVLPSRIGGALLWSPANTGPLRVANQVLTIHDLGSLDHPEWYSSMFATWYRWLTPELLKRVRRVITISRYSQERLLALAPIEQSKVAVVYGGVGDSFHPRPADESARVRSKLGIRSPHYLLSLSALEPRKNIRRVLAAWSSCVARLPDDIWLVVAGASAPRNVFSSFEMGELPPRVHFAGFVADADLPALYSGALALVYVSLYEGFGLPALEAMACGTVPIVSDNTSLPEVVGDGGIYVDPFDPDQIAAAIERVVDDSALRAALRARAGQQSRRFSWTRAAAQTWTVLREAMDRSEARPLRTPPCDEF
jgi:glycosyltransferase involved in cell wall biosynthesis